MFIVKEMEKMKLRSILLFIVIPVLLNGQSIRQSAVKQKYDQILNGRGVPSLYQILKFSESNNSYNFMAIGYFFDANNIMFKKTKDKKYLEANWRVYDSLFGNTHDKSNYYQSKWSIKVRSSHSSAKFNGMGSLVYEGYFFRYLANFYDILKSHKLYEERSDLVRESLAYTFERWSAPSIRRYGDQTNMYHQRLHIGSHWATVAMILHKYSKESKYLSFYNDFNAQLKKAMKIVKINNVNCYQWDSTYPERFTSGLKQNKKYAVAAQDVSHGNHVVQFIIDSYSQHYGNWNKTNLTYLGNTAKNILWKQDTKSFSTLLNGKGSNDKDLKGAGLKLSDGWMKLMSVDNSLKEMFSEYFDYNQQTILPAFQGLQTLAVLYSYGY